MLAFTYTVPVTHLQHDGLSVFFGGAFAAPGDIVRTEIDPVCVSTLPCVCICEGLAAQLSDSEFDAVLAHELGHVALGHLDAPLEERAQFTPQQHLDIELAADAVAVRVVGAAAVYSMLCLIANGGEDEATQARINAVFKLL